MSRLEITPRATEQARKGTNVTLHAHGDGTYHTTEGGSWSDEGYKDHDSFGAAVIHMAKNHAEGDHMHIEGHDNGFTTHHVLEGKNARGPDEHKTLGALKKHISQTMDSDGDYDSD